MYMDETGHISSNRSQCNTMEKGGSGIYTQVATCLNETKIGGETSKSKILRILTKGNIGIANMHKYKNEVGCGDDTVPKTVDTRRHCEEE